jgi:hypothetical protein
VRSNSFDRGRADEWREIQDRGAGKANIPRINIRPTPPPAALWIICLAVDVQYLRNFCVLEMQC